MKKAIRTACLCAALSACTGIAAGQEATAEPVALNISTQPLAQALAEFAVQANLQLVYYSELGDGLQAPAVVGRYTPAAALRKLLADTPLRANFVDAHTVVIRTDAAESRTSGQAGLYRGTGASVLRPNTNSTRIASLNDAADVGTPNERSQSSDNSTDESPKKLEEVLVTGTHIRGETPIGSEIITITREDIDRSGYTTIADVMRSLPQNFASISPRVTTYNTTPVGATSPNGTSAPDLRGIGASSTLTLVDGRRLAVADTFSGGVDISAIPLVAVERIEVLADGTSAIYGSDAVAGVVNIILKKGYDGLQTDLSYGDATDGGGATRRASALLGTNWLNGNIMLAYEYFKQNAVEAFQRDFTSTAPLPFDLLPRSSSSSFFLSTRQSITEELTAFLQGNYLSKQLSYRASLSIAPFTLANDAPSKEYGLTAGLDMVLGGQWTSSLVGSAAKQEYWIYQNLYNTSDLTTPFVVNPPLSYEGTVQSGEWNANGPVFDFGAGPVRTALGGGYRHEALSVRHAVRNVGYAFTEFSIPLLKPSEQLGRRRLELNVSGRFDHYSDFGSKAVPRFGLLYSPFQGTNLRASWGKSFRAPTLQQLHDDTSLDLIILSDPHSPSGSSTVIHLAGANPQLGPESARSWTVGFDYEPPSIEGLKVSATYFDINYTNRISAISNVDIALINPLDAPFVQYNPTVSEVQSLVNTYGINSNQTPDPYDPTTIGAIVDGRNQNIAQQSISGIDSSADYKLNTTIGMIDPFINTTYLRYQQRTVPLAPQATISGIAFSPPRFRGRGGVTFSSGPWSVTALANYLSGATNTYQDGNPHVASWTTVDASLIFAPSLSRVPKGLRISAAVQNILNRDPPYVASGTFINGLNFDPLNTTPLGRFATIGISIQW